MIGKRYIFYLQNVLGTRTLYVQVEGLPMGSPLSPVVANIFIESFENTFIITFRRPPKIWKRYVDDTFVILSKYVARRFLVHINNMNEAIQLKVKKK